MGAVIITSVVAHRQKQPKVPQLVSQQVLRCHKPVLLLLTDSPSCNMLALVQLGVYR